MTKLDQTLERVGYFTFFLSGISAISTGIIVSILRDKYGLSLAMTGTLLSLFSVGNMVSGLLCGVLPSRLGLKGTALLLTLGYFIGYILTTLSGAAGLLMMAFLLIGIAKGCVMGTDSVLVGQHASSRTRGMQLMHASYAAGALLCPFVISFLVGIHVNLPMICVGLIGLVIWIIYFLSPLPGREAAAGKDRENSGTSTAGAGNRDYSFLRESSFWILTFLLFCQNAAETGVTGWLVTYYKDTQILKGNFSAYSMTIMWGATLIARLIIAFVLHIQNNYRAITIMGLGCSILYAILIFMDAPLPAVIFLFAFSAFMAGINPMVVAGAGSAMTPEGMGIMLPLGGIGGIVMPLIIGLVADRTSLRIGMFCDLIPCIGIVILSSIILIRGRRKQSA